MSLKAEPEGESHKSTDPPEVPMSREAGIMAQAKEEISKRESWSLGAQFSVDTLPQGGWKIVASRIRSAKNGRITLAKEYRTMMFDVNGTMTSYRRGK